MNLEIQLAIKMKEAENGVEFNVKTGAACPWCKERMRVVDTKSWEGDIRVRYHRCYNPICPLCVMEKSIKSVQSIVSA